MTFGFPIDCCACGMGQFGGRSAVHAAAGGRATPSPRAARSAIDIHSHYFPQQFLEALADVGPRFKAGASWDATSFAFTSPAGSQSGLPRRFIDLRERIAAMDGQGVKMQALSLTTPMVYFGDGEASLTLSRAWNDAAVAAHLAHPDRFVVLAMLPMLDPDRAIGELDRVARLPGVRGVYMGTNINGRDLDDPLFAPIWARIEAHDLPVFLHPLQTLGGARLGAYYLNNFLGNPYETGVAAARLIFGGVLDRHPRLEINLPHAGGVLPILIGRMDHGWSVRAECKHLEHAPSTYLRRFTYDTIAHSKAIMQFVISQVGVDRVMIGSDYCYDMGYEQPVGFVGELDLAAADRDLILGGTAARLLKLDA